MTQARIAVAGILPRDGRVVLCRIADEADVHRERVRVQGECLLERFGLGWRRVRLCYVADAAPREGRALARMVREFDQTQLQFRKPLSSRIHAACPGEPDEWV